MTSEVLQLQGVSIDGSRLAAPKFEDERRAALFRSHFGTPMFGTFNVEVQQCTDLNSLRPSVEFRDGRILWWFYLCDVRLKDAEQTYPAWIVCWSPDAIRSVRGKRVELISRVRLPEQLRHRDLQLTVYGHWSDEQRDEWVKTQYWWQSFAWAPRKADSKKVWEVINVIPWEGKTVLDIGGHTGYFSFQAARLGAIATVFEPDKGAFERGKIIGRHIEPMDAYYTRTDPGGNYDTILYLSVHHQFDPTYSTLADKLTSLKARCKDLFVELISPPLKGELSAADVDRIVGVTPMLTYKHNVRCMRSIYHLQGAR